MINLDCKCITLKNLKGSISSPKLRSIINDKKSKMKTVNIKGLIVSVMIWMIATDVDK